MAGCSADQKYTSSLGFLGVGDEDLHVPAHLHQNAVDVDGDGDLCEVPEGASGKRLLDDGHGGGVDGGGSLFPLSLCNDAALGVAVATGLGVGAVDANALGGLGHVHAP